MSVLLFVEIFMKLRVWAIYSIFQEVSTGLGALSVRQPEMREKL